MQTLSVKEVSSKTPPHSGRSDANFTVQIIRAGYKTGFAPLHCNDIPRAERKPCRVGIQMCIRDSNGLGQIFIEGKRPCYRARNLGNLERMGEPCADMVALGRQEYLRFMLEPAECLAVDLSLIHICSGKKITILSF